MSPGFGIVTLAAVLGWVDPSAVGDDVEQVLGDERYEFCDVEGTYTPWGGERDFCELLDTSTERCPGYREACLREVEASDPFELDAEVGEEGTERDETTLNPRYREGSAPEDEPEPVEIPMGLARVAQVLMWLLLALGLGWLIYTIFKNRAETAPSSEADEPTPPDDADPDAASAAVAAAARIVETDVERLLRIAQEAAGRGDYRRAVDAAHAALLRRLDGEGIIEITVDKTNGDYLRQVGQRNAQLRQELRPIVREVEQLQFGTGEPDRGMFQRVFDRVVPVVRRTILVLAVALGLGAVTTGCDDHGTTGEEIEKRARESEHRELGGLSTDPLGARAVVQLLRRHEVDAVHRTRTVDQLTTTKGTIVVAGEVSLLDHEWEALLDWADEGHHLVVAVDGPLPARLGLHAIFSELPLEPRGEIYYDEYGVEQEDEPLPVGTLHVSDGFDYEFYNPLSLRLPVWRRLETAGGAPIDNGYYVEADDAKSDAAGYSWRKMLEGGGLAYAATTTAGPDGEGRVTVFADSLMFTNAGIAVEDNATFVVDLLDGMEGNEDDWSTNVEFVNSWTGAGAQSPMEAIQNSHLTPLLLQLLASLILFYWWRGAAFGTLRDPPRGNRRSFAEHVEALGLQYAKARASKHALSLYAGFAIERLRERLRPGTGGIYALAQAAAAQTGRNEGELMTLLVEMHELRDAKSSINDPREHVNLMRKIHDLLKRTGGAR